MTSCGHIVCNDQAHNRWSLTGLLCVAYAQIRKKDVLSVGKEGKKRQ